MTSVVGLRGLVPAPVGFLEWIADYERRRGVRVVYDELDAAGTIATWWCRSPEACAKRRAGAATLELEPRAPA